MSQLIRLVYASRSTFSPRSGLQGLDPGIARILARSRRNNAQRQIVGALLFGDGCFMQCLEGESAAVEALFRTIEADPRHRDVRVLARQPIGQRSFGDWSMKYVPGEATLRRILQAWGMTRFDPFALTPGQVDAAIRFMQMEAEGAASLPAEAAAKTGSDDAAGAQAPSAAREAVAAAPPRRPARALPTWGWGVALAALVAAAAWWLGRG